MDGGVGEVYISSCLQICFVCVFLKHIGNTDFGRDFTERIFEEPVGGWVMLLILS